ncbi:MAG: hypothetical protein Q8941_15200 [Bacteroidota bacterium]|nr:hypothetical protein [Bacteroidota bacterium]
MPFLKEDLSFDHYIWKEERSKSTFSGQPSRRLFDRFDGDQVLFMINFYGSLSDKFTIEEGRKIEELIINQLPADTKSEISVFNWLREAYALLTEAK